MDSPHPNIAGPKTTSLSLLVVMAGVMRGFSGGDLHAIRLAERWARSGAGPVKVMIPTSLIDEAPVDFGSDSIPLMTLPDRFMTVGPIYLLVTLMRMLQSALIAPRADVYVAASHFAWDIIPGTFHRLFRKSSLVAYVYHLIRDERQTTSIATIVSRLMETIGLFFIKRFADIVFIDNIETGWSLNRLGVAQDRLRKTANSYDPLVEIPRDIPRRAGSIVFCGRLVPHKGIGDLLDVAERLKREGCDYRVDILGDGPMRSWIAEKSRKRDLEVVIHGFVGESRKWELLASSELFVFPSYEEGWGIAPGEALVAGTPVVAYDLPAYQHFQDRIMRVPKGAVGQLEDLVLDLFRSPDQIKAWRKRLESEVPPSWDEVLDREIDVILNET